MRIKLSGPIPDMEDEEERGEEAGGAGAVFAGQLHCCSPSDAGRARHCSEDDYGGGRVLLEIMWGKPISNVRAICRFNKMIGVRVGSCISPKSSEQNGSEIM